MSMLMTDIQRFGTRMTGALRLDARTYEEVEADRRATWQALAIVVLASVAAGIGFPPHNAPWLPAVIVQSLAALTAWVVWAGLVYLIGVHILPAATTRSSVGELLRTTGFSTAPALCLVLGVLPVIGPALLVLVMFWLMATMVMAVRQALDYDSTARAAAVCGTGLLLAAVWFVVLGGFFAPPVL